MSKTTIESLLVTLTENAVLLQFACTYCLHHTLVCQIGNDLEPSLSGEAAIVAEITCQ